MTGQLDFKLEGTGSALRYCALLLHSLRLDDRAWLMANLAGPQVNELEELLGELDALGIPVDSAAAQTALRQAAVATAAAAPTPSSRASNGDPSHCLQGVDAAELAQLLRHEPTGLIAQVLRMCGASERKAVLAHLSASQRQQVEEWMASAANSLAQAAGPCSLQAALEYLSARLQRRPTHRSWRPVGAVWQTRLARLRSIFP